jgi:NADPH:quinone reductase-like Zn-dependent oxidoreductase
MRAIVHRQYGTPDILKYEEIERPIPGADDVLVRVHAAGASIGDHHIVTGMPFLIRFTPFGGFPRPRNLVPGACFSGRVDSVGANVTAVRPGDEVIGQAPAGAFAEYVVIPASMIAPKPANLTFEEAAATPWAVTALQALRDAGGLKAGQKVLINGASGGIGTWAVQIAKAFGAHVTAVCSTRNIERMRALGADDVIDYTTTNFVDGGPRFDLLFDTVGNRSLSDFRRALHPTGAYVSCGGGTSWVRWAGRLAQVSVTSMFTSQTLKTFIVNPNQKDLLVLKELVESGKAKPVVERRYPLSQTAEALRRIGQGHTQGQTVIQVAG